jgi:hypothetical protein
MIIKVASGRDPSCHPTAGKKDRKQEDTLPTDMDMLPRHVHSKCRIVRKDVPPSPTQRDLAGNGPLGNIWRNKNHLIPRRGETRRNGTRGKKMWNIGTNATISRMGWLTGSTTRVPPGWYQPVARRPLTSSYRIRDPATLGAGEQETTTLVGTATVPPRGKGEMHTTCVCEREEAVAKRTQHFLTPCHYFSSSMGNPPAIV